MRTSASCPKALRVVALAGEQTSRPLRPNARRRSASPIATRCRALPAIRSTHSSTSPSDPPNRPHSPAFERQSAVSAPIPRCRQDKSAALRSSDDPLQSVSNPTRACAGRIATVRPSLQKRGAERADTPPTGNTPRCTGRVAGGPHRADYYRLRIPESSSRRRFALRRARHPPQRRLRHTMRKQRRARARRRRPGASPAARGLRIARRTVVRPVRRVFPALARQCDRRRHRRDRRAPRIRRDRLGRHGALPAGRLHRDRAVVAVIVWLTGTGPFA